MILSFVYYRDSLIIVILNEYRRKVEWMMQECERIALLHVNATTSFIRLESKI